MPIETKETTNATTTSKTFTEPLEKVSTHFLVVDRNLRPEGVHFAAEGGYYIPPTNWNKSAAVRPTATAK